MTHLAGNLSDLIKSQVSVMLDVLLLLAITSGLLKGLDDVASSGGLNLKGGNTVGNGQLNANTKTLVVLGLLGDVFLNLLGRDTEGTNLLCKSGTSTFTTDGTDEDYTK